jgi:hypothetical protein
MPTFGTDFFSMLRSWHNNRALPMYRIWKQFDLALVTATEPYHLIADLNQSPFNVGEVIALKDFNAEQVRDLNQRHGSPLSAPQERQLMDLLQGHPYLVRRALYLLAKPQITVAELFKDRLDGSQPLSRSPQLSPVSHLRQAGAGAQLAANHPHPHLPR